MCKTSSLKPIKLAEIKNFLSKGGIYNIHGLVDRITLRCYFFLKWFIIYYNSDHNPPGHFVGHTRAKIAKELQIWRISLAAIKTTLKQKWQQCGSGRDGLTRATRQTPRVGLPREATRLKARQWDAPSINRARSTEELTKDTTDPDTYFTSYSKPNSRQKPIR